MLFYEVKLVHPETMKTLHVTIDKKAILPSKEDYDRYPGAILVINTLSSKPFEEETKKAA